ncbi:MAG: DUF2515 domain-containing protein [Bacillus sp. (in: Bacteria)]|nr:DUF2515 domain-containing protein [Bacillus sp. (in: firmicutes)]
MAGRKVLNFTDVGERIKVGKQLYTILFGISKVNKAAFQFAKEVKHTGSRADYWHHVYTKDPSIWKKTNWT